MMIALRDWTDLIVNLDPEVSFRLLLRVKSDPPTSMPAVTVAVVMLPAVWVMILHPPWIGPIVNLDPEGSFPLLRRVQLFIVQLTATHKLRAAVAVAAALLNPHRWIGPVANLEGSFPLLRCVQSFIVQLTVPHKLRAAVAVAAAAAVLLNPHRWIVPIANLDPEALFLCRRLLAVHKQQVETPLRARQASRFLR